jgi:hypothetical protein
MAGMTTISELLDAYRGGTQEPVPYRPATWLASLEPAGVEPAVLAVLTDDAWTAPATRTGDRLVGRADLERLIDAMDVDGDVEVLRAFLLTQAWGTGTTGNRTIRHTTNAFRHRDALIAGLRRSTDTLRGASTTDALVVAYEDWAVPGVGQSFLTKWFAHAGRVAGRDWQPLILDQRVLRTLNSTLSITTKELAGTGRWAERYRAYVDVVHTWAREVEYGATAPWIEWVLFRHNGAEQLPSRAEDRAEVAAVQSIA